MTMIYPTRNTTKGKKYRSHYEIIYTILNTMGQRGTNITKILYGSYTSYERVREYLNELIRIGLIHFNEETKTYRVTSRGEHFMQIYSVLRTQLGEREE